MSLFASTKPKELHDQEFGTVSIRIVAHTKYIRLRMNDKGELKASMPRGASLSQLKALLDGSREELRRMIASQPKTITRYVEGDQVGLSHTIHFETGLQSYPRGVIRGQRVVVQIPSESDISSEEIQAIAREWAKRALKKQATSYLPRRLKYLAELYGYDYERIRYSSAKGRWGSCSSHGTISVNIALMKLPVELIDYVLVHELVHTKHMNHSKLFWDTVRSHISDTKDKRKRLKLHNPYV